MGALLFLAGSAAVSFAFMRLYVNRLSKTGFFSRKSGVETDKKSCVAELHAHKAGTPTMGGLVFFVVLALSSLAMAISPNKTPRYNWLLLLFAIMGFADDYIKIKRVRDGVTRLQKLIGLTVVSAAVAGAFAWASFAGGQAQSSGMAQSAGMSPQIRVPFIGVSVGISIAAFFIVAVIFMVASSNSMNITDGVDGLAAGISALIFAYIMYCAYVKGDYYILYSAASIEGGLIGFLWYNKHPARVFMGDTGSLLLGGAAAFYMIALDMPLWLIMALGVCYFETLSVVIQLASLKLFGKRVFKIAPFHHHLEKCGWKETRIVLTLCSITAVLLLLSALGGF